jgi:hypothetical protein
VQPNSLSVTGDELELFYVIDDTGGLPSSRRVVVRRRASTNEAFGQREEVDELVALCGDTQVTASLDVTLDGLRMYLNCQEPDYSTELGPLRFAERSSRTAAWVVATEPIGMVQLSIGVSQDELTLFSSPATPGPSSMFRRLSLVESFGEAEPIPGLDMVFTNLEPTSGGLQLYGAVPTENLLSQLGIASRSSTADPFGTPAVDGLPLPVAEMRDASPAVGAGCERLYFLRVPSAGDWTVMMTRR